MTRPPCIEFAGVDLMALTPEDLRVDGPIFTAVVELLATVGECDKAKRPTLAAELRLSFIVARQKGRVIVTSPR